jgi:small subunit ribosomal protein S21
VSILARVVIRDGDTIDSALTRFKNQVRSSGKLDILRRKEFHMSNSEKRRLKSKEAKAKNKKKKFF